MLVDWNQILPPDARVVFSSFSFPGDCDEWDRDVAAIQLPHGYMIDVEWCHDLKQYTVTLSRYDYDNQIHQETVKREGEVVQLVQQWSSNYTYGTTQSTVYVSGIACPAVFQSDAGDDIRLQVICEEDGELVG